jgi:glycosyltransferase involved in cell wall biosynthesis
MGKQKIYWFIQQTKRFGGTETVSLNLLNLLYPYYDITLVTSEQFDGHSVYPLPEGLKILSLGLPEKYIRVDDFYQHYKAEKKYWSMIQSIFYVSFKTLFARRHYRQIVKRFTSKDDILISSSLDSYLMMPHGRKVMFHYHFNSKCLFSFGERFLRLLEVKPQRWVFITEGTFKAAEAHRPFNRGRSDFVYNPVRLTPQENYGFNGGRLIFIGRLAEQKRPLFLIQIATELLQMGISFRLDIYGTGPLKEEIQDKILKDNLSAHVFLDQTIQDPTPALDKADLMLLPSAYEGFPLVIGEANSQSVPVLSSDWGSGLEEAMKDGTNGYIIREDEPRKYAETIARLFQNPQELTELKKNSYQYSKRLSGTEIEKKWFEIIAKMEAKPR